MRAFKRILLLGSVVLAIGLGMVVGIWLYIGRPGHTPIEDWIGRQIVTVLENYITPEVAFEQLDYRRPTTVILHNLTLTDQGQTFVAVDRVALELAEVPREGKPIQIQRIELSGPHIHLDMQQNGNLAGWSGFVRPEVGRNPAVVPAGQRLSDILVLRHVRIENGEVRYTPAEGDPMILPGIDLVLRTEPAGDASGWYKLNGRLERDPVLRADVDGRINLDTGMLELDTFAVAATFGPEQYQTLPPAVQEFLRRHEVEGELIASFQGRVPLRDSAGIEGTWTAQVQDALLKLGRAELAVGNGRLSGTLPDGPVRIEVADSAFTSAGHTLIAARRLVARLDRIPRGDGPVEIAHLDAESPMVELIHDPAGGFRGWNRLGNDTPEGFAGGLDERPAEPEGLPNKYVRIHQGELRNGQFVYGPPDSRPITLHNIHISLRPGPEDRPEWQPVTASGRSEDLFHASLTGRFNLGALVLALNRFQLNASVAGEAEYALLPAAAADLFRRHGMTGDLTFTFNGQVPFARMNEITGQARADLRAARLHFAGVEMPVERAVFDFDVPVKQVRADVQGLALIGDNLPILDIERLAFDLAVTPRAGEPLEIHAARFERPRLQFVQAPGGSLLGWRQLVNPETPWPRLGNFVRFQQMDILDGEVLYDDNDGEGEPMVLTGIDMRFHTPRLADAPGWYRLGAAINKPGLFDIQLDGRINPDAWLLEMDRLEFQGELGEQQYAVFPPQVQNALRRHEIRGRLALTAAGRVPLKHLRNTTADIRAELRDAFMVLDETVWPIDHVAFDAALNRRGLTSRYQAGLLGGQLTGNVSLNLDRPHPLQVTWNATGMRMEDTLRVMQPGPPKYAGRLSTQGQFSLNLHEGSSSLAGSGTLHVTDGKLVKLPVIRAIVAMVSTATLGLIPTGSDQAEASFELRPDHVVVNRLTVDSDAVDLRATGRINYDKTVDMRVTVHGAENIGRGIGTGLGRLGEIGTLGLFGKFSDEVGDVFGGVGDALAVGERLVTYRVSGDMSNPQVTISGLGKR